MGGDVVLSAGVRQNLLALQDTARMMSLTQNRLATGKKVNSALDNPVNFFTASGLSSRAKDLGSLLELDGERHQDHRGRRQRHHQHQGDNRIDEIDPAAGAAGQVLQELDLQRRPHRAGRHRRRDLLGWRGDRLGQRRRDQCAGRADSELQLRRPRHRRSRRHHQLQASRSTAAPRPRRSRSRTALPPTR